MAISLPSVFSVIVHGRLKCWLLRIYTRSRLHAKHARRVCRSSITRLIFFMTIWTSYICCKRFKILDIWHKMYMYHRETRCKSPRLFLTSLRLFVEKKYLRSRRVLLAWTKNTASWEQLKIYDNCPNCASFCMKYATFRRWKMLHTTDDSRGARDCFDKSQIVCREKIFEILPNTSRLYQSTENHKNVQITVINGINMCILYENGRFPINWIFQNTENQKCPNNRDKLHKYVKFTRKWAILKNLDFPKHLHREMLK